MNAELDILLKTRDALVKGGKESWGKKRYFIIKKGIQKRCLVGHICHQANVATTKIHQSREVLNVLRFLSGIVYPFDTPSEGRVLAWNDKADYESVLELLDIAINQMSVRATTIQNYPLQAISYKPRTGIKNES